MRRQMSIDLPVAPVAAPSKPQYKAPIMAASHSRNMAHEQVTSTWRAYAPQVDVCNSLQRYAPAVTMVALDPQ